MNSSLYIQISHVYNTTLSKKPPFLLSTKQTNINHYNHNRGFRPLFSRTPTVSDPHPRLRIRKHLPPIDPPNRLPPNLRPTRALLLINPDTFDEPVRLDHIFRIIRHILLARRRLAAARAILPHAPGPLATKRRVEDEIVVFEMVVDVARAGELRRGLAPRGGVGLLGFDVLGDFGAGEKPDLDGLGGPLGGVDAAAVGVEASAEAGRVGGGDAAASVLGLLGVFDVAVCCGRCA